MTILIYDDIFLKHDTGPGHPENAKRLENTLRYLEYHKFLDCLRRGKPRPATVEEISTIHPVSYITAIKQLSETGGGWLDGDTCVSGASYDAAVYAAGAALTAIDIIMKGEEKNGFCLIRPPGHHATPERGMGFCLFNNVALAARYLQAKYQLKKILIIDFDVHHGNGTQDAFYQDPSVLYFSLHRYPFYPGTGRQEEDGKGAGKGFTINVPLPAETPSDRYLTLFSHVMEQKVNQFAPEFIIISAGFDAYKKDPIGGLNLDVDDFHIITKTVMDAAESYCAGKIVSCLEGGYSLTDIPLCIEAHLKALLNH